MSIWARLPDPCDDCGRIHVFCPFCGWKITLERPMNFFCIRCGAETEAPAAVAVGVDPSPQPAAAGAPADLSERQLLQRLLDAPAAHRVEPPSPDEARWPTTLDVRTFLFETWPKGHPRLELRSIGSKWEEWCDERKIIPRARIWLSNQLKQNGMAKRITAENGRGRRWQIHPQTEHPRAAVWRRTLNAIRDERPGVAAMAREQTELLQVEGPRVTVGVHPRWLETLEQFRPLIADHLAETLGLLGVVILELVPLHPSGRDTQQP